MHYTSFRTSTFNQLKILMKKLILFIYIFIASIYNLHAGNNETDSLLLELDRTIKERPKYISHKEEILINLKIKFLFLILSN